MMGGLLTILEQRILSHHQLRPIAHHGRRARYHMPVPEQRRLPIPNANLSSRDHQFHRAIEIIGFDIGEGRKRNGS